VATWHDGRTAEWLIERPNVNNSLTPLQNFNVISWTSAQALNSSGNWNYINGFSYQINVTMTSMGGGAILAQTGGVGGTNGGAFASNFEDCSG
jgi:hypothetical protein